MPIDFNPHILKPIQPSIVKRQNSISFRGSKDIFIKSIDKNYENIKIEKSNFGKIKKSGQKAILYTITNKNGASVELSSFGATIVSIKVPNKDGKLIDITQGYPNVTPYEESPVGHAGGTIGPYANKINKGKFILNGEEYNLECNKDGGKTHSHGGSNGFDVQNWDAKILKDGIEFSYLKKDMENGYPGNLKISVIYKLDNKNQLHIIYKASSDKDTVINLTNHSYFNLDGEENSYENSILNHYVKLTNTTSVTKTNNLGIPTGELIPIKNSPFDFSEPKQIGNSINEDNEMLKNSNGYDQNFCIDNYNGKDLIDIAEVYSEKSGIKMNVSTNLPGFQFYSANNLGKSAQPCGKSGTRYEKRSAFCIEPQFYPNSINIENFKEKGILRTNEEYNKEIIYSFSTL